jgi:hypothetical protein
MKKLMLIMSALAAVSIANAWTITATTNATATMIVPPAVNLTQGLGQLLDRGATNTSTTVAMGEFRRINGVVAVAANAGTLSEALTTNSTVTAGGTYYGTNVVSGYVVTNTVATTTNTVVTRTCPTVPLTGLSAVDGDVYWFRVPATRNPVYVQATLAAVTSYTVTNTVAESLVTNVFEVSSLSYSVSNIVSTVTATNQVIVPTLTYALSNAVTEIGETNIVVIPTLEYAVSNAVNELPVTLAVTVPVLTTSFSNYVTAVAGTFLIAATPSASPSVTVSDSTGALIALDSNHEVYTFSGDQALYATASATNCVITVIEQ